MLKHSEYRFETERLLVDEWHSIPENDCPGLDLVAVVLDILTADVTRWLPESWQGEYTPERAKAWITERASDGVTTLVVEKAARNPIGLMILFSGENSEMHLGYMLGKSSWGKGFASELVAGLARWCEENNIVAVYAGVAQGNPASRKVLEKNGFSLQPDTVNAEEQMFKLAL